MSKDNTWASRLHYPKHAVENWTKKDLEEYEREWKDCGYIMITWPDSQRIKQHPYAELEYDVDLYGSCAYWCPREVWEKYSNSYYEGEGDEE